MNLIESPGEITSGEIWYRNRDLVEDVEGDYPDAVDGEFVDLLALSDDVRRSLRGTSFSMIFQDPESSFNPTLTVGEQLAEAVEVQRRASANPRSTRARTREYSLGNYLLSTVLPSQRYVSEASHERAIELLELVGIPDPVERADEYPHEYSGGMLQRAMIAQALAGEPDLLIADEPTTALDVTIQAQILDLDELQAETGMTILLITHNLGVIARMCDQVGVMYAGEIVERGTLEDVFDGHVHPTPKGCSVRFPTSSARVGVSSRSLGTSQVCSTTRWTTGVSSPIAVRRPWRTVSSIRRSSTRREAIITRFAASSRRLSTTSPALPADYFGGKERPTADAYADPGTDIDESTGPGNPPRQPVDEPGGDRP